MEQERKTLVDIIHHIRPAYPGFFCSVSDLNVPFIYGGATVKYDEKIENEKQKFIAYKIYEKEKMSRWIKTLENSKKILLEVEYARKWIPKELWHKTVVLHNSVDTNKFNASHTRKKGIKKVLFLSNIRRNKGADILMKSIPGVVEKYNRVKFIFVGKFIDKPYFENLIKKLDIDDYVDFKVPVSSTETLKYYNSSDIFCLPTLQDNSPNSLLEAMACALPVITSNVMVIPEIVTQYENGILVSPGNVEQLKQAILTLLVKEELSKKMWKNNRKKAVNMLSWEKHIEKLIGIYQECTSP